MDYTALQLGWNPTFRLSTFFIDACERVGLAYKLEKNIKASSTLTSEKASSKGMMTFYLVDGTQLQRDANYHQSMLAKANENAFNLKKCFLAACYFLVPILFYQILRVLLTYPLLALIAIFGVVAICYKIRSFYQVSI